ncbi:MAG: bifunctional demethylmenaquinone methyltransferase/2-methoxy-6-polyprenyl-1,4-benzoquinol methylase UbiE [Bacteroidaceae bacterium]|nr:bifunctional demethylmenaquinone methyltransferase/2-methoxy-6-polyprenyl-1,4-benzoquinol methylase UbiE [Bacteroidaceae bacterium]MBR1800026.1 bifunctional demethylmenaquinone methyltransferase/2-methoxy-6-polyprenyl-1,4-benzoquinol methylase UbiE [Bacteroidaceae bacterium]
MAKPITPKREQVETMFNHIAPTYDRLNHTLSLGIDRRWRREAIDALKPFAPQTILDIATGTGDFAILAAQRLDPDRIIGVDISEGMMDVGREKVKAAGLDHVIYFMKDDSTALSFDRGTFDAVTVAYGARNFADLEAGLSEMCRVLKPGGHLMLVELTTPPRFPMKQLFWIYSKVIMSVIGRLVSHDDSAYTYLPRSMEAFPQAERLVPLLRHCGFSDVRFKRFTFGLSTMYLATK